MFEVAVRGYNQADESFVMKSWLQSYRHDSPYTRYISDDVFFDWNRKIAMHIVARQETEILIATPVDDHDLIIGFCVSDPAKHCLHFAYTRKDFRLQGIARRLFTESGLDPEAFQFTHLTNSMIDAMRRKAHWIYNPYLI